MPDYTRDPSPCAKREYFEKQLKTSIRRGGHYSSAISGAPADHDWIYFGNGYVIDIPGDGYPVTKRQMNPLEYVIERVSPSRLALDSANNADGQPWNYHLAKNNCQHFAYWCSTGKFISRIPQDALTKGKEDQNEYQIIIPPYGEGGQAMLEKEPRFSEYSIQKKMVRPNPF